MFWRRSTKAKLKRLKKAMNEFLTDFDGQIWTETASDGTKTVKVWYVNRRDKQTGAFEMGQVLVFEEKK